VVAIRRAAGGLVQGDDSFPGEGLGEADAVTAGLAEVGVVHEPVDGGGGQGLGHQLVESGRVQVRAHRHAAFFVGGVDQPVEAFGGVGADRQEPDVVDHDQVRAQDAADGLGDRVVGAVRADQHAELFEGEPGDVLAGFETVIIPEMNLGQLCTMIRARYLVDAVPFSKVKGRPFQIREIVGKVEEYL